MIKLLHGDCSKIINSLSKKTVDLIITSPPYNIGINYNNYNDKRIDYVEWLSKIFNDCCELLKDDGHLFINLSSSKTDPFTSYKIAEKIKWKLQNNIIWAKSVEIDGYVRGYNTPTSSKRYLKNGWEHLFHFTKLGETKIDLENCGVPYNNKYNNDKRMFKKTGRTWTSTTNCWHYTYQSKATKKITKEISGDKKHPAIYPKKLVDKCIKMSGIKKGLVLDPFVGTGTTGLAAKENNLNFIGIDIDKDYLEFAQKRINNEQ